MVRPSETQENASRTAKELHQARKQVEEFNAFCTAAVAVLEKNTASKNTGSNQWVAVRLLNLALSRRDGQ